MKALFAQSERALQQTQQRLKSMTMRSMVNSGKRQSNLFKDSRLFQSMYTRNLFQFKQNNIFNTFKRNFSNGNYGGGGGFDRLVNLLVSRLPNGNIAFLIIALNSLFYFLYLTWPRHQMYSYMNNFTFSKFNL